MYVSVSSSAEVGIDYNVIRLLSSERNGDPDSVIGIRHRVLDERCAAGDLNGLAADGQRDLLYRISVIRSDVQFDNAGTAASVAAEDVSVTVCLIGDVIVVMEDLRIVSVAENVFAVAILVDNY